MAEETRPQDALPQDARFEDAGEAPIALRALEAADIPVLSALIQDAIFPGSEMRWDGGRRRFAVLLNRYRWEQQGGAPERVQAVLAVEDVQKVASQGIDRSDPDLVFSVLSLTWTPAEDGMGRLELTLAGDGAIALDVEALEATLTDVTRPYAAVSGKTPGHAP